jgi:predicted secreted acid phosphatase
VQLSKTLRRSPRLLAVIAVVLLAAAAVAYAATQQPAIQTITPQTEDQMTNIDVLRQQIKNYYGAPLAKTGPTGTWADPLNLDSNYAHEAEEVASEGGDYLADESKGAKDDKGKDAKHDGDGKGKKSKQAIILDVDDTSLATWNYELYSNWDYNPTTNADFVLNERFPAVPGMADMANEAASEGYAIIYLTGRPATQEAATVDNLKKVGMPAPTPLPKATLGGGADGLFTKPAIPDYPPYLTSACSDELGQTPQASCTTIHYKSATRAYVESLGYHIVANFGDQWSDLIGGHADRKFKLPNPNYYLP